MKTIEIIWNNTMSKASLFFCIAILLVGCDEESFFEVERPTQSAWNTVNDLEFSVNDTYKALFYSVNWQDPQTMTVLRDYVVSDLTDHIPDRLEHGFISWFPRNFGNETTGTLDDTSWQVFYRAVTAANGPLTFLEEKMDAGVDPFPNMTDVERAVVERQMGELYHMRAYTYYLISRVFLPPYSTDAANNVPVIPLKVTFDENVDAIRSPNLGNIQEVYAQIILDLNKAKNLIPESYAVQGKVNTYSASAMLYRIYWLMGNKADALPELDYVINSGKYDLSEEPIAAWNRNYEVGIQAKEVIWERSQTISANYSPKNLAWMTKIGNYRANNGGRDENYVHSWASSLHLSQWATEKIGWMDASTKEPTAEALADLRYQQLYWFLKANPGSTDTSLYPPSEYEMQYPQQKKNAIWTDKFFRAPNGWHSQIPLIRLPELYLSRATIKLANGDVGGATMDLNMVRNRAGLADFSGTLTENDIEIERIKEMAGECGDRMLYLIGMQKIIDGDKVDQLGNPIRAISPPYSDVFLKLPASETNFWNE